MIQSALTSLIVGDALGSAVDGMSRGHIHAHFKNINGYIDPETALKNKLDLWRKPGLYSSISQMMLIMAMVCPRRGPCTEKFQSAVAAFPEVSGYDYGIFRYPGALERSFILRSKEPIGHHQTPDQPCARIIPVITFLSFRNHSAVDHLLDVMAAIRLFTLDLSTLAVALVYSSLIRSLAAAGAYPDTRPIQASVIAAGAVANAVDANSAAIFSASVNPGSLIREIRTVIALLEELAPADTIRSAEEIIISHVNRSLKTPVTRATVNLPSALFPYSLAVSSLAPADSLPVKAAVSEGGATAALAAMAGAIGAFHGTGVPPDDSLVRNLVNRKKVLSLIDDLTAGPVAPDVMEDFIRSEALLTAKEQEEHRARLKHAKTKQKKPPPTHAAKEKELTRHVVESWTKYDKARWKKEQRRHDKNDES